MDDLEYLRQLSFKFQVSDISKFILNKTGFDKWTAAASPNTHHYGQGGLVKHTKEVVDLCLRTNEYYNRPVNETAMFLAALFHDIGKVWDYRPIDAEYKNWESAPHKKLIHHICRSALVWQQAVTTCPVSHLDIFQDEILHAILAHHGHKQWGSPVEPKTKMAWILHLCDGLSARIDDCERRD